MGCGSKPALLVATQEHKCVSLVQVGTSEFLLELDRGVLHYRTSGPHIVCPSVIRRRSIWSGVLCHWGGSNSFA